MIIYKGKSVYKGIAIGKIKLFEDKEPLVKRIRIKDPEAEKERFFKARQEASNELHSLYEKACHEVGAASAAIFEIHQMMLEDEDYTDSVENIIQNQSLNAEYAVLQTSKNFSLMFSSMSDSYMQARAEDVKDISDRIIRILTGNTKEDMSSSEPVILAAEDLAPSETVSLDKSKVLAFITKKGSSNSHTAILARTMNIPALIGIDLSGEAADGKMAIVDGFSGKLYLDPDEKTLFQMHERLKEEEHKKELLKTLKGKENITKDGKRIKLFANIGSISDLASVLENDADGIGLFRSEFIYLDRSDLPTEEEQFEIYKTVAQTLAGRKVIIRTLDIGADKQAPYLNLPKEENPAMGVRAIRLCLTRPEIFKTQLRAIMRAAVYGNISIMYPMIISVSELDRIKSIVNEVSFELKESLIPFKIPEQGIMIETPASVMISDMLAKRVSFFSIGTNDLSQYTLAIDRQNPDLDDFFDPHSEAVLRMIELVIKNAHEAGIWAGICGEMGADTNLTERLLKMGVDELSVSPSKILSVRKIIRDTTIS